MRFFATEPFIYVDAGFNHVTIKSEIRHCLKLISLNTGELLWIMIHTNIILKQALYRTEIEGNDVDTDSIYTGMPKDFDLKWKTDFPFIFLDENPCTYAVLCALSDATRFFGFGAF